MRVEDIDKKVKGKTLKILQVKKYFSKKKFTQKRN